MTRWTFIKCLIVSGLLTLAACGREVASGPPTIRYGQDACSSCGMIVSDDRFAAALVNPAPDASPLLFDDVGCLLAYEHKNTSVTQWTHYFHDAASHQWITADQAFFVKTPQETPMGSGIFVLQSRSDADSLARSTKCTTQTYAELSHVVATASVMR